MTDQLLDQRRMFTRRLPFEVIAKISQLALWLNTNDTEVVETAVRKMYNEEAAKQAEKESETK